MSLEQLSKTVDFVQSTTPSNANDGETWLDTSQSPPQLKVFDASANAFARPRSVQNLDAPVSNAGATQTDIETAVDNSNTGATVSSNLDAPVSEAGASAEVKQLDLRFVREMSRLFFDRSMTDLNFSDGTFEIFTDRDTITTSSSAVVLPGTNGKAFIGTAFDISEGFFTGTTRSSQKGSAAAVTFSDDGEIMVSSDQSNQLFFEYSLTTPFDIETATFTGTTLGSQGNANKGVSFADNGTKLIEVAKRANTFYEYSMTTPFDIGTASTTGTTLGTQDGSAAAVAFSDDGTTMIEVGASSSLFYEYSLTTPFDIGTASTTGTTLSTQDSSPTGITFSDDGTTMVESGGSSELFYEYSLTTPFDIGTANFTGTTLSSQSGPSGVAFSGGGKKMIGVTAGSFNEYSTVAQDTGTGTVSKSVTLAFTPTTVVVEDTREDGLNASYDITDGNGNTVTVTQSEIGTTVDCSTLTDGSLTVTANLDNPNTAANALRDFAVYFD